MPTKTKSPSTGAEALAAATAEIDGIIERLDTEDRQVRDALAAINQQHGAELTAWREEATAAARRGMPPGPRPAEPDTSAHQQALGQITGERGAAWDRRRQIVAAAIDEVRAGTAVELAKIAKAAAPALEQLKEAVEQVHKAQRSLAEAEESQRTVNPIVKSDPPTRFADFDTVRTLIEFGQPAVNALIRGRRYAGDRPQRFGIVTTGDGVDL